MFKVLHNDTHNMSTYKETYSQCKWVAKHKRICPAVSCGFY